jgi:hypothetical protein
MIAKNMLIPILVVIRNIDNTILVIKLYKGKHQMGTVEHIFTKKDQSALQTPY